jgi:hypothetical protein
MIEAGVIGEVAGSSSLVTVYPWVQPGCQAAIF